MSSHYSEPQFSHQPVCNASHVLRHNANCWRHEANTEMNKLYVVANIHLGAGVWLS